jgi:starch phosphorylase
MKWVEIISLRCPGDTDTRFVDELLKQISESEIGKMMTSGVDVWLNTPQPPLEASGTSGMKTALDGVPSLSVLDGWWIEGCIEGVTGWSIGEKGSSDWPKDAASLYSKLEQTILPISRRSYADCRL